MGSKNILSLRNEFEGIDLGDKRLNDRCIKLVEKLGRKPGASIPESCSDMYATKAAYRFFWNPNVTREELLKPHIKHAKRLNDMLNAEANITERNNKL